MRKFGDAVKLKGHDRARMDSHVDILISKETIQKELPKQKYMFDINSYYFNMDWLYDRSVNNQKLKKYFEGSDPDIENNMCAMNVSYVARCELVMSYNIE